MNQCTNCGVQIGKLALWAETHMYHILIPCKEGAVKTVDAVLLTDAPEVLIQRIMSGLNLQGMNDCMAIEDQLHAEGCFAVLAKWEARFI